MFSPQVLVIGLLVLNLTIAAEEEAQGGATGKFKYARFNFNFFQHFWSPKLDKLGQLIRPNSKHNFKNNISKLQRPKTLIDLTPYIIFN